MILKILVFIIIFIFIKNIIIQILSRKIIKEINKNWLIKYVFNLVEKIKKPLKLKTKEFFSKLYFPP